MGTRRLCLRYPGIQLEDLMPQYPCEYLDDIALRNHCVTLEIANILTDSEDDLEGIMPYTWATMAIYDIQDRIKETVPPSYELDEVLFDENGILTVIYTYTPGRFNET